MLGVVPRSVVEEFFNLVDRVQAVTGDDLRSMKNIKINEYMTQGDGAEYAEFRPRISQLKYFLENTHHVGERVVQIGSLYNTISDAELRSRCSDLLSAPSHFDRVINQATVVLEDRIRKKAGADRRFTGVQLVNEYIKAKPAESRIVISDNADEQEGFANMCRGIMQALRNETHHHIVEKFSREEAFHICGFIDRLLKLIDDARVRLEK